VVSSGGGVKGGAKSLMPPMAVYDGKGEMMKRYDRAASPPPPGRDSPSVPALPLGKISPILMGDSRSYRWVNLAIFMECQDDDIPKQLLLQLYSDITLGHHHRLNTAPGRGSPTASPTKTADKR